MLSRIGAGLVSATAVQVAALRAMLDSVRRDGGRKEDDDQPWREEAAAFSREVAEQYYRRREAEREG